jgi:Arc/MetJ-type ribon-helix-helix transcriptional regulator
MKEFICRLSEELHETLRKDAFENRVSMSELIRTALEEKYQIKNRISHRKQNLKRQKVKSIDPITLLSEASLREVWDNPLDDCYNDL